MEFRLVDRETLPQVMELWDYCFEKRSDPFFQWYFSEYCLKDNIILGGFSESTGRLAAMLHLNPYAVKLRGAREVMPYIVGVATAPEERGRHLLGALLQNAFARLRAQRFSFALLMPVYAGIYQRYAFAYTFMRRAYKIPLERLKAEQPLTEVVVRRVQLRAEYFSPVYEAFSRRRGTVILRGAAAWQKLLTVHRQENVLAVVTLEEERLTGYMFYSIKDEIFCVRELIAETPDAQRALLRFAAAHRSEARTFEFLAEENDTSWMDFPCQDDAGKFSPFMMARCINVAAALAKLKAPTWLRGTLTLSVRDAMLAENNRTFTLVMENGEVRVFETENAPDAAMDVSVFTQLYFGAFGAAKLERAGRIQVASAETVKALESLLPKQECYANEYF